ncbi:DeoR/GlpR family DNA-binding transcription regulator [Vallitaleaceae bacterium 9-2]
MIPYVRRSKVLEFMHTKDIVFFEEIADRVGVSLATVRRDLKTLEEEGQVEILTGGAAKIMVNIPEKSLAEKMTLNKEEKMQIGSYAATKVGDGQFIFLGPGTTEDMMIKHLAGKNVTVVTNGAFHIQELLKYQINTIILGGEVMLDIGVVIGPTVIRQISCMNFDKCFIGASGVIPGGSITTSSVEVAEVNKIALKNSAEAYIIADSTKLGKRSRYTFGQLDNDWRLITTSHIDKIYHHDPRFIFADI